jgi:hypothetical protein
MYFGHIDVVVAAAGTAANYVVLVGGEPLVSFEVLVDCELLVGCGEDSMGMRWNFGIATLCCW